jgi:hypothetical protein
MYVRPDGCVNPPNRVGLTVAGPGPILRVRLQTVSTDPELYRLMMQFVLLLVLVLVLLSLSAHGGVGGARETAR